MSSIKIVIVDYGVGNTHSVKNAISELGYRVKISDSPATIKEADALVLPGVGAFDTAIKNLRERGLEEVLNEEVLSKKKPIIGICVGMQMMATYSDENGRHEGLNWIPGKVTKLDLPNNFMVPHVGWNDLQLQQTDKLFTRLDDECHFYFDHSYHFQPDDAAAIAAQCDYGVAVTAAIQKENICGVQFHPEKSQTNGLKMFRSFFSSILPYA